MPVLPTSAGAMAQWQSLLCECAIQWFGLVPDDWLEDSSAHELCGYVWDALGLEQRKRGLA